MLSQVIEATRLKFGFAELFYVYKESLLNAMEQRDKLNYREGGVRFYDEVKHASELDAEKYVKRAADKVRELGRELGRGEDRSEGALLGCYKTIYEVYTSGLSLKECYSLFGIGDVTAALESFGEYIPESEEQQTGNINVPEIQF